MKKMLLVLSFCFLGACAKDVAKNSNPVDTGGTVTDDSQDYTSHTLAVFANHASASASSDIYSSFTVTANVEMLVPAQLYAVSFSSTHPSLILTKNGTTVCQYVWVLNKYQASSSCPTTLQVLTSDTLNLINIPKSQTGSLSIYYKRL